MYTTSIESFALFLALLYVSFFSGSVAVSLFLSPAISNDIMDTERPGELTLTHRADDLISFALSVSLPHFFSISNDAVDTERPGEDSIHRADDLISVALCLSPSLFLYF